MNSIFKIGKKTILLVVIPLFAALYLVACGSKPDPGPTPKPPWPDSPADPSLSGGQNTSTPRPSTSFTSRDRSLKADVAIIALGEVWVLVKPDGQPEIWKNLRKGERFVIPKTGKLAITYSSGKNIQIEAAGRIIKPSGGNEGVGFLDLE